MQFKNNLSCICSFLSMSIIFTLCTLNSTLVNYYYNVKYTTYMVYFSITIYSCLTKKKLLLYVFLPNNPIHRKHILFFFFKKGGLFPIKAVPLYHQNPPSLSTMLQCAGRFIFIQWVTESHSRSRTPVRTIWSVSCSQEVWQLQILPRLRVISNMKAKIDSLLADYPAIDTVAMGFPRGWENEPLWR